MEALKIISTGGIVTLLSFFTSVEQKTKLFTHSVKQYEQCIPPTRQPISLRFDDVRSNLITGSFNNGGIVDNYLVVRCKKPRLSVLPRDGSRYMEGDELGEATVVLFGPEERFTAENLEKNTTYYFFVFAANDCAYGPVYNRLKPLWEMTKTTE